VQKKHGDRNSKTEILCYKIHLKVQVRSLLRVYVFL